MSSATAFYPQHFRNTRPYLKSFLVGLGELIESKTMNPRTCHELSGRHIMDAYNGEGAGVRTPKFNTQAFTVENQAALMYGQWTHEGGALFSFKPELTEALRATGLADISINELHFPFDCGYFHFGPQSGLTLQSGARVTGAFVMWVPGSALRLMLTAPLPEGTPLVGRWAEVYDLRILARHFDKNIEEAIAFALADDIEDIRQAARTLEKAAGPVAAGSPTAMLAAGSTAATHLFLEAHSANKETLAQCFQLIANALCYLTAFPEDSLLTWQENTPEKLRQKADAAPGKESARALSKLNAMGYRKVQDVGGEFSKAVQSPGASQVSPHWRRGHWRSQAHGPQMSLRKLIWLRPTRVLGASTSEEPRVYATEKPQKKS